MEIQTEDKMVGGEPVHNGPRILTYYEKEGRGVEDILRCANCKKLVVQTAIRVGLCCPKCGNKRFNDVQNVSGWEMFLIRIGWIDFPDRDKFLKEFSRG